MPLTDIEWTDRAWPVVNGCRRVSPGCENCWAERLTATRLRHHPRYKGLAVYTENGPRWTGERRLAIDILDEPLRTKKPQRWFVANKGDLFSEEVTDEQIAAVFGVMAACPQHTFQVLTKRPERMARWFDWVQSPRGCSIPECVLSCAEQMTDRELPRVGPSARRINGPVEPGVSAEWPLRNVWIGVSVEDQQRADERVPHLLRCPAAVRFLSLEPLIGPVDLTEWIGACPTCGIIGWPMLQSPNEMDDPIPGALRQTVCRRCNHRFYHERIDWVIVGGESGPGARACSVEWVRSIVAQCRTADIPVFVKQLGALAVMHPDEVRRLGHRGAIVGDMGDVLLRDRKGGDPSEWPYDLRVREWPEVTP